MLVIVAMAATLIGPAIDAGLRAREVRSAARTVAGTLRTLQGEAVRTGKVQHLVVDPDDNALRVEDRPPIELGEVARISEVRGGDWLPRGAVRVAFYPNGGNTGLDLVVGERGMPAAEGFVVGIDPLIGLVTIRDPRR